MTGRRPFAFVEKEGENKHSNRLVEGRQVWMRWEEGRLVSKRCSYGEVCVCAGGVGGGEGKVVLAWSQHRGVTICWPLFVFLGPAVRAGKQTSQMQAVAPQVQQFSFSGRIFCVNNIKMWQFFPKWPLEKMSPRRSLTQWFQFCKARRIYAFMRCFKWLLERRLCFY